MFMRSYFLVGWIVAAMSGSLAWAADMDGDGVPDGIDVCCNTAPGSVVDAVGRPYGDADEDCDVDLADFAIIAINFTGPGSCTSEVCDGLDNDCDCVVDNMGFTACGVGACHNVVQMCSNGVMQTCTPLPPSIEICNGIDDDCNGVNDDPFDLLTDVGNCGACGVVCPARAHANPVCVGGQCDFDCLFGYDDCDLNPANGCEADLASDAQHCGTCNSVCLPRPNASPNCSNFTCVLICDFGYVDCNSQSADGCETNVLSDVQNCGGCNNVCPPRPNAQQVCQSAACLWTCLAGYSDCNGNMVDGCEVDVSSDANNCGACGVVCSSGDVCVNQSCVTP